VLLVKVNIQHRDKFSSTTFTYSHCVVTASVYVIGWGQFGRSNTCISSVKYVRVSKVYRLFTGSSRWNVCYCFISI